MSSGGDRALPSNPDAERFLLGSIMLRGDRYPDVASVLPGEAFSLEKHRRIYARMKDLYDRGENIDRVTLMDELIKHDQLESVDGLSYLVSLDQGLPEFANLDSYVRIVMEKSMLRETMLLCDRISERCSLASESSSEILEMAAAVLDSVRRKGEASNSQWITPGELIGKDAESLLFPAGNSGGIQTPWRCMTEMTSGYHPGDLVIVAGRPGMGKSVVGMQQALTTASQGVGVAYFSLEMSKESLVRRLVAGLSRVDSHRARSGFLNAMERRQMLEAAADLDSIPLFIDDSHAHTPTATSAGLRKLRARSPVGLVIVDHLQLMKVTGRSESRHSELSEICHGFKHLAVQMGCVVMLLSQLNRSCEQDRRVPNLSDLKESGSIEEDADVVVFIHRAEMYKRDDPALRGKAEFIVAKQRNGPTGKLPMTFLSGFQVFEEASTRVEEVA